MNSRFASMRWPERAATAAMEMDCASATMVSAKARLSRSGSARQSTLGTWNGGQGWAMAPSTGTPAPPHAFQAAAAIVPAARPASI